MVPPCLILSNIKYVSGIKWSNPGKGVAPYPTPWCSSYRKGSLLVALDYNHQLYLLYLHNCICCTPYIMDSPSSINTSQQERQTRVHQLVWHNHIWYHLCSGCIVTNPRESQLSTNYCLTRFSCILFLLLEYICFSIKPFVFPVLL